MPSIRRRGQQRREDMNVLTPEKRRQLLKGHDFFGNAYGRNAKDDPEALELMREDWELHKDELLDEWIHDGDAGYRPWAWWEFSAPARREPIDGQTHPFDRPERKETAKKWHAQYPNMKYDTELFRLHNGCPKICVEGMVRYESQADYLTRLNLLLPGEAELLDRKK